MHQNSCSNVLASLMVSCLGGLSEQAGKEYTICMKIALLLFENLEAARVTGLQPNHLG